jgi:hypothetical protein
MIDWCEYLNSGDQRVRIVASGVSNMDQSLTKIQLKFHLKYLACFFWGGNGQQEVPSASQGSSGVWFFFIFHSISFLWQWIARGPNLQQKFNLKSISLSLSQNYTLCNCTSKEKIKPSNTCDHSDHLAWVSEVCKKKQDLNLSKKHNGYREYILLFFCFVALWKKHSDLARLYLRVFACQYRTLSSQDETTPKSLIK